MGATRLERLKAELKEARANKGIGVVLTLRDLAWLLEEADRREEQDEENQELLGIVLDEYKRSERAETRCAELKAALQSLREHARSMNLHTVIARIDALGEEDPKP